MDLLARETGRVKGRVGDVALLRFISGWFGGSLLLIAAIAIVWVCWDIPIFQGQVTVGQLIAAFLVVLATATVPVLRLLKPRKVGRRVGEGLGWRQPVLDWPNCI